MGGSIPRASPFMELYAGPRGTEKTDPRAVSLLALDVKGAVDLRGESQARRKAWEGLLYSVFHAGNKLSRIH